MESVNSSYLISAGRDLKTPFRMSAQKADGGPKEIEFVKIYRVLPAKRIVALAMDQGELVLVKIFLGRFAERNATREVNGVRAIAGAGVHTPELLWSSELHGNGRILAFRYLPDASSLNEQWQRTENLEERVEILCGVMKIMSRLHVKGVVQQDIHLDNFLLTPDELHAIDGGGIQRKSDSAVSVDYSIKNLALFFAQFRARFDNLVPEVFEVYEQARGWDEENTRTREHRRKKLLDEISRCRESRKRDYIDKSFRNCTRFICQSSFKRFMVCERTAWSSELEDLLHNPDQYMDAGEMLKNGNSATVTLVHSGGRSLVIKRYNIKGLLHGLRRLFRNSRARVSWSNAHHMEFLGIPALKPVAMLENRIGLFSTSAYLITEYIEGPDALHGLEVADQGEPEALVTILQELSDSRISHGDLKATNFLMSPHGPVMIDLDAMREHKSESSFIRAFRSDLKRFMANWEDSPELTETFANLLSGLNKRYGISRR